MTRTAGDSQRFAHIRFAGVATRALAPLRDRLPTHPYRVRENCNSPAPEIEPLARLVLHRAGIRPERLRADALARRVPACLRALRASSVTDACDRLRSDPDALRPALDALLIGFSEFFRDRHVHAALLQRVLAERRGTHPALRVWSAGCSDGQELYSIAMSLGERRVLAGATLLGTDIRASAIANARRGCYTLAQCQSVPARLRLRYFTPAAKGGLQVCTRLRSAATWAVTDVFAPPDERRWDVILCRNLALYLAPPALDELWRRLHAALAPAGVLVVGRGERPAPGFAFMGPCLFQRKEC